MGYEYLIASLPELKVTDNAPMTMEALETLLDEHMREKDKEQLILLNRHARQGACDFVNDWLDFNKDLNNILTAEVCRKHGLDVSKNITGELPDDIEPEIKAVSKIANLYDRERQIDTLRFIWLEERTRNTTFDLENVLAYYLKNQMLCRWSTLTNERGEQVFRAIVADMKKAGNL